MKNYDQELDQIHQRLARLEERADMQEKSLSDIASKLQSAFPSMFEADRIVLKGNTVIGSEYSGRTLR